MVLHLLPERPAHAGGQPARSESARPVPPSGARAGFVVGRSVGNSVVRHRVTRQLRAVVRTESALIEDMAVSARRLGELKASGIRIAVDDFGTGYSALAYLQRFPLDILKLDRSFINQQIDGAGNANFIKAFIDLAHALNLSVVAEGIETAATLETLRSAQCDEGQGYLFSRPLSLAEFQLFLARLPSPAAAV